MIFIYISLNLFYLTQFFIIYILPYVQKYYL
jgi:hypothetical protein